MLEAALLRARRAYSRGWSKGALLRARHRALPVEMRFVVAAIHTDAEADHELLAELTRRAGDAVELAAHAASAADAMQQDVALGG